MAVNSEIRLVYLNSVYFPEVSEVFCCELSFLRWLMDKLGFSFHTEAQIYDLRDSRESLF